MKRIGIIGCGWLGLPLMHYLQDHGYHVFGTKRVAPEEPSDKLFQWDGLTAMDPQLQLLIRQCDGLVVTIPPQKELDIEGNKALHLKWAKEFTRLNDSLMLVYTSSTSVYGEQEGEVFEKDAERSSRAYAIEKAYLQCLEQTALVRFGGLIGAGRDPYFFFKNGREIPNPNGWINMTHMDDAMASIHHLLRLKSIGIYNVVSPLHATRRDFYTTAFARHQSQHPAFGQEGTSSGKLVNSDKIQNLAGYKFRYPSILDALSTIEAD